MLFYVNHVFPGLFRRKGKRVCLTVKAVQDLADRLGLQTSYVSQTAQTALNTQTALKEALKQLENGGL